MTQARPSREGLRQRMTDTKTVLRHFPHLCAHLICTSLGYATPSTAASILHAYIHNQEHYCEWINACYANKPQPAIQQAFRGRRYHRGYMADYTHALALVMRANKTGEEPIFASWF